MEQADRNLTARESLDLIAAMIHQAKGAVQKNSFYFLLWGWVVVVANLGVFTLLQAGYARPYLMWLITVPAWFISMYRAYRSDRQRGHATILGQIILWTWVSFSITIFSMIFFSYHVNHQLNPLILLVSAIPTFVSGVAMRFRPLILGGVLFWVAGIICFLVPMEFQNLISAAAVTTGYLIPGHLLKRRQGD